MPCSTLRQKSEKQGDLEVRLGVGKSGGEITVAKRIQLNDNKCSNIICNMLEAGEESPKTYLQDQ